MQYSIVIEDMFCACAVELLYFIIQFNAVGEFKVTRSVYSIYFFHRINQETYLRGGYFHQ